MITRLIIIFLAVFGAGRVRAADAKTPAPPVVTTVVPAVRVDSAVTPSATYETFRLIGDRNIFNPNRTGRRDRSTEERAPRLDTITLVGTMDYEKGVFAFFDGSEAAYRKALRTGESVDQFKVVKIQPDAVDVEHEGKTIHMQVAQQLRRPEGADWNLVGADVVRNEAQARAAAAAAADAPAIPTIPADASEAVRRMMENRQKALNLKQ